MQIELVIVPQWVKEAVEASNSPKEILLDPLALTGILSKADVAFYILLNTEFWGNIHPYVSESFVKYDLLSKIMNDPKIDDREMFSLMDKARTEHSDMSMLDLGVSALNRKDLSETTVYRNWNSYVFDIKPIHDTVLGISFIPMKGMDVKGEAAPSKMDILQTQLNAIDRSIKEMLIHLSFERVALTPIFREFTKIARFGISM